MNLSDVFSAVAHKVLVAVDLPDLGSNQHELNGNAALKSFFGTEESTRGSIQWHFFADDEDPLRDEAEFTFYDARAKSAERTGRAEWRFYYYGSFLAAAAVGDLLVLARTRTGHLFGLVFENNSAWFRAAWTLFGIKESGTSFDTVSQQTLTAQELEFIRLEILRELDLQLAVPSSPTDEELMLQTFGRSFPKTKEMAAFARAQVQVDCTEADKSLLCWLDREEQLFRALENVIISERLAKGFANVDEFIEFSLSVQNRRKSRMGFALQNHLEEVFTRQRVRYTAQAHTEGHSRPDFIFPGEREYRNPEFDPALLVMLGVKSTCKDRWRQVLAEADRVPDKHLCTLEAGISTRQTDDMQRHRLTLVLPTGLHETYTAGQREKILSVAQFVEFIRHKQQL